MTLTGSGAPQVTTRFEYDALGRVWRKYLPYVAVEGAHDDFTYDALGRATLITHSSGGSVQTVYALNTAVTTDEASSGWTAPRTRWGGWRR